MPYGYTGKVLHVNLTKGELEIEEPDEKFYRTYMGGSAMGLHYVLKETPAGVDPFSPDNVLALCTGVLTGTPVSGQSRLTSVAKSPLTGCIGDAQGGGYFPAEMKFSGFDAVIIKGKSPKPVYLWMHHGEAELRDAGHLWGLTTGDAEDKLKEELDDKRIEVLQIGPAGENLVRFSALISMSNRANGRTGMGAVMGSKNLKAVVVRGKMKPAVSNPEKFKEIQKLAKVNLEPTGMDGFGKYGTPGVTTPQHKAGGLPTYNFNSGNFDKHEEIDGLKLYNEHLRGHEKDDQNRFGRDTCFSCSIKCKRVAQIDEGPFKTDAKYGGPEYETLATFGSYCGISDMDAIIHANALCNMYGMDTISCGATIAWAMECWEEGKITAEDTGGIELQYGNAEAMAKITEMIANREGFGEILAEGSKKAAEIIGRGTEDYLITSKGQEAPAHMPQVKRSLSVIYAANPFGADHESSEHDPGYKAYPERMKEIGLTNPQEKLALNKEMMRFAMITQHLSSAVDSLSVCAFVFGASFQLYSPEELVKTVNAVMGWDVDMKEILEVGERRLNMLRAFNSREGVGRESDTLPKKMFKRPLEGGRSDGYVLDEGEWEVALEDYYRLCDWDVETGHPSLRKMESLGLGWVVAENEALSHAIT
ncbi:MAG: putative oxidoreductase YdhV [Deltaproteobacteria bacterium]|jgi:aldehyde:ferredoxin oxidoreductase|nr:putative oxidoreductase YdhV [Deltaproteobacteria bacterium]